MSNLGWKTSYVIYEYTPEFLDWYGKRMADMHKRRMELEDEMARAAIEAKYPRHSLVPLGALLGGLIGIIVARILL